MKVIKVSRKEFEELKKKLSELPDELDKVAGGFTFCEPGCLNMSGTGCYCPDDEW